MGHPMSGMLNWLASRCTSLILRGSYLIMVSSMASLIGQGSYWQIWT